MSKQANRSLRGCRSRELHLQAEVCGFGAPCCPFPACVCALSSWRPLSCVPVSPVFCVPCVPCPLCSVSCVPCVHVLCSVSHVLCCFLCPVVLCPMLCPLCPVFPVSHVLCFPCPVFSVSYVLHPVSPLSCVPRALPGTDLPTVVGREEDCRASMGHSVSNSGEMSPLSKS